MADNLLFINEVLGTLKNIINKDDVKLVEKILINVSNQYTITQNEITALSTDVLTLPDPMMNYFLAFKTTEGLSSNSLKQYKRSVNNLISFVGKNLLSITTEDIITYLYTYKNKQGVSYATVENERRYLSAVFSFLYLHEKIKTNPMNKVQKTKAPIKHEEILTEEEIERIRLAIDGDVRDLAMIYTFLDTGARISELSNLNIGDVDFDKKIITIRNGKGGKDRVVPFTGKTKIRLETYLKTRPDINVNALSFNNEYSQTPLFVGKIYPYNRLGIDGIGSVIKYISNKTNIPRLHAHLFRKTAATNMLRRGIQLDMIAKFLGHTGLGTVQRYAQTDTDKMLSEIKRMCSII